MIVMTVATNMKGDRLTLSNIQNFIEEKTISTSKETKKILTY